MNANTLCDVCPRCDIFLGVCVEGAAQDVPGDSPSAGLGQGRAGHQDPAGGQCCVLSTAVKGDRGHLWVPTHRM